VVVLGGGFLVLGRGQPAATTSASTIKPLHPVANKARAKAHASVAKKSAAKPRQTMIPTAVSKARQTQVTDGMPAAVSAALVKHPVVVVSLVAPDATTDELAYQEAKAGARQAGAGFVRISVGNNDDVQALSTLVGTSASPGDRLLDAPAVLVLRQPHDLYVRFNGFIDAATIAQAATNAAPVAVQSGASELADPWVSAANAACRRLSAELKAAPLPTSTAQYLPYVRRQVATIHNGLTKLRGLKPPVGRAAEVKTMLDHYDAVVAIDNGILDAAQRGNLAEIQRLAPKITIERAAGDDIAAKLGAADCANG
jgi:hypothetical protein